MRAYAEAAMAETFPYNIFISYSSVDVAEAVKLEGELKAAGLTPFRDKARLTAGQLWEPQLVKALKESQHLVLLLSTDSEASDWVTNERMRFMGEIDPNGNGIIPPNRSLLAVCLDQKPPPTLSKFHGYTQPLDAGGDAARRAAGWKEIVESIVEIATDKSAYVNVPVVVFAMTTPIIANSGSVIEVPPMVPQPTVDEFLGDLSIASMADLQKRYGATPDTWKPSDSRTVREILEVLLFDPQSGINVRINDLRGPKEVRWTWPDLMNADINEFKAQVRRLRSQPMLVIVDPISLCNSQVKTRFDLIESWLQNREASVIILPPFRPKPPVSALHQWLQLRAAPLLNFYYDPPAAHQTYTGHVVSAAEDDDILRVVKNALCSSDQVIPSRVPQKSALITP